MHVEGKIRQGSLDHQYCLSPINFDVPTVKSLYTLYLITKLNIKKTSIKRVKLSFPCKYLIIQRKIKCSFVPSIQRSFIGQNSHDVTNF